MKTFTVLLLIALSCTLAKGQDILTGSSRVYQFVNGTMMTKTLTRGEPQVINPVTPVISAEYNIFAAGSAVRWSFTDPIAIGDRSVTSANGLYQATGWGLNTERISLYNNLSSTPLWEFSTNPNTFINYVAISDTGGIIASGSYHNIYIFNRSGSTPIFDFNLETSLSDTGIAGPLDITGNGRFLIASASRNDSSWILGFSADSVNPAWRFRVGQTGGAGGAGIQGIKISGNDSLVIANTYGGFYVFRTYTGQLIFQGLINPSSSAGTQFPQGISGNGSIIATINYSGNLRVYQWNGSTYNLLWQHSESGHWMTAVDVTYDGSMISCGTLNFLGGSNYDGKVKLFRTTNGSTPLWTYSGCGDEVNCVSFSKDGRILSAASWGDLANANNDLLVFKTSVPAPAPVFAVNSPGSFFWCNTSENGSTVIASGKRIHARAFGNGGEVYNIFIDTNDTPLGIENNSVPASFRLHQNYPNPFNPATQINYEIPVAGLVKISVYDILGRELKTLTDKFHHAGRFSVIFDGTEFTSGVYFYRITAGSFTDTKKLILAK